MKKIAFLLFFCLFLLAACTPAPAHLTPARLTPDTLTPDTLTPSPELATAIPLNPDIKAALGNVTDYTVAPDGNAVIALKDTNQKVEIVKAVDVKTNDGLAKDIKTGYDKDGNRFIFVENYGWIKDIDPGTPEKRTQVPYEWFGNGAVNTIAALHYQDSPTIPAGAIEPQWWFGAGGSREAGAYIGTLTQIPNENVGSSDIKVFTESTKPFGSPTLWLEFSQDGQDFVTVVQTYKNPDKDNGRLNQLINMNWTFDKGLFDQELQRYEDNLKRGKIKHDNIIDYFLNDRVNFQALFRPDPSRPTYFAAHTYLIGPDKIFHTPNLQKPGELLSLFTPGEQAAIISVWQKEALVPWGQIPNSEAVVKVIVPPELALKPLTADYAFLPWGNIQP